MNAEDIMTRAVVTVSEDTAISDAIRLMLGQRISGLPVVDSAGRVVGMLTEGDLLRRAEMGTDRHRPKWLDFLRGPGAQAGDYVQAHGRKVGELMTRAVESVTAATPLVAVVDVMERRHFKRVPVVQDDHLVGVVSRSDLLRALAEAMTPHALTAPADAVLRKQVVAALCHKAWGGRDQVTVIVTNGVVYLEGIVYDVRERDALRVAAENTPGVKAVRDNLEEFDPTMGLMYGV